MKFLHRFVALLLLVGCRGAFSDVFVSSHDSHEVMRYRDDGSFVSVFVSAGSGGLNLPHELVFGPDNHLLVCSANNDRILRYDGLSGDYIDTFVANQSGGLDYPASMRFGPDGHLYVSSQLSDEVLRYDGTSGAFIDVFVTSQSGGLIGPSDLIFGPDTNLYVTGRFSDAVYRYNGTNGMFMDVFIPANLSQPFGLDFGPGGNLFVSSGSSGEVLEFDGANGALIGVVANGLGLPVEVEFQGNTHLYICSYLDDSVEVQHGASLANFVPAGSGGLDGPNFIAFRPPQAQAPGAVRFVANAPANHEYGQQLQLPSTFGVGEFTLELWIRPDNTFPIGDVLGGNQRTNWFEGDPRPYTNTTWWYEGNFLLDGHNNAGGFENGTFSLQFYGGGRVRWDFGDGSFAGPGGHWSIQAWPATNTPSLLDGEWHRVECVRRWAGVSDAVLELWVDAVMVGAQTSNARTDMRFWWDSWLSFPGGQEGWF
ncbi:MAG: NHL repeat-containing protein, partial [Verrucomicrobiota bacterium]